MFPGYVGRKGQAVAKFILKTLLTGRLTANNRLLFQISSDTMYLTLFMIFHDLKSGDNFETTFCQRLLTENNRLLSWFSSDTYVSDTIYDFSRSEKRRSS